MLRTEGRGLESRLGQGLSLAGSRWSDIIGSSLRGRGGGLSNLVALLSACTYCKQRASHTSEPRWTPVKRPFIVSPLISFSPYNTLHHVRGQRSRERMIYEGLHIVYETLFKSATASLYIRRCLSKTVNSLYIRRCLSKTVNSLYIRCCLSKTVNSLYIRCCLSKTVNSLYVRCCLSKTVNSLYIRCCLRVQL